MTTQKPDEATVGNRQMIAIRRGTIHLSRELCDAHLRDVGAVALLSRDDGVLIVPLTRQSAGGLLLKIRNARGDRVVHAAEFLRERGLPEDFEDRRFPVAWNAEMSALAILGLPPMQTDITVRQLS